MQAIIASDKIQLRQKKFLPGSPPDGEESLLTLSSKLTELFEAGYVRDDIYGLVIPLLMQGKVRIDLEDRSERLEIEDHGQRFQRTQAVQIFEEYLKVHRPSEIIAATSATPAATA
ncbi:MAG: hypothetical protein ACOYM3_09350 [Terrimicrobiaceae bacterium]